MPYGARPCCAKPWRLRQVWEDTVTGLRTRNHYVPELYLKAWADAAGKVDCYRLLVPNEQDPTWKRRHLASVGYRNHLYAHMVAGRDFRSGDSLRSSSSAALFSSAKRALRPGQRLTR